MEVGASGQLVGRHTCACCAMNTKAKDSESKLALPKLVRTAQPIFHATHTYIDEAAARNRRHV